MIKYSSKKGSAFQATNLQYYLLIMLPLILLIIFGFLYLINLSNTEMLKNEKDLEIQIIMERFVTSPSCFVYYDNVLLKAYPYVLDLERFNDDVLDDCVIYNRGFRLTLQYEGNLKTIKTSNWDSNPLMSFTNSILVYDGVMMNGTLIVEVEDE